jgi:hypothetical protein
MTSSAPTRKQHDGYQHDDPDDDLNDGGHDKPSTPLVRVTFVAYRAVVHRQELTYASTQ